MSKIRKKLTGKQTIIITSTFFGMLFGSGNLIFPVHLGQMAGGNFFPAICGFLVTGVGLPILSVIVIGFSESNGFFSLTKNVSRKFAMFITFLMYLTIGPLFVMPRSASISYNAGLSSIIGNSFNQDIAFLIFSLLFFGIVTVLSLRPSKITTWIGKIINPLFLICLFVLIIVALTNPMGGFYTSPPSGDYDLYPFFNGFLEGYGTMDVLAGLAYGIIIINIVKDLGIKKPADITRSIATPSCLSGLLIMVIYICTIIMGVQSLGQFSVSSNGSVALNQISNYYFGLAGNAVITIILTLASIKTSIALATSCASTFQEMFPKKLNYKIWVVIFIVISFLISNLGLDPILEISTPVLAFLYPVCMVLIILGFAGRLFKHSSIVYKWTIGLTCIAALFDFIASIPHDAVVTLHLQTLTGFCSSFFPFSNIGFSWLIPALIGFVIGIIAYISKGKPGNEKAKKN